MKNVNVIRIDSTSLSTAPILAFIRHVSRHLARQADPNDPANPNRGNAARRGGGVGAGRGAGAGPARHYDPNVPNGRLHPGNAEWWIVLTGQISAKFEVGSFIRSLSSDT